MRFTTIAIFLFALCFSTSCVTQNEINEKEPLEYQKLGENVVPDWSSNNSNQLETDKISKENYKQTEYDWYKVRLAILFMKSLLNDFPDFIITSIRTQDNRYKYTPIKLKFSESALKAANGKKRLYKLELHGDVTDENIVTTAVFGIIPDSEEALKEINTFLKVDVLLPSSNKANKAINSSSINDDPCPISAILITEEGDIFIFKDCEDLYIVATRVYEITDSTENELNAGNTPAPIDLLDLPNSSSDLTLLETDCNGDSNGLAYINSDGICVGGNTGLVSDCFSFDNQIEGVIYWEGGFVDNINDEGGKTNYGITEKTWDEVAQQYFGINPSINSVSTITLEQAKTIYKNEYWDWSGVEHLLKIDGDLAMLYYNIFVNTPRGAGLSLQKAINRIIRTYGYSSNFNCYDKYGTLIESGQICEDGFAGKKSREALTFLVASGKLTQVYNWFKDEVKIYYLDRVLIKPTNIEFQDGWLNRANSFNDKTSDNSKDVNCN